MQTKTILLSILATAMLLAAAADRSSTGGSGSNSGPGNTPVQGGCTDQLRRTCDYNTLRACNATEWPDQWGPSNPCCPDRPRCRLPNSCTQVVVQGCNIDRLPVCAAGTVPTRASASDCCPLCRRAPIRPDGCTIDPATLPLCLPGATPVRDANGCNDCRQDQGRNGNCTLAALEQCRATFAALPSCGRVEPERQAQNNLIPDARGCCLNCKPDYTRFCNQSTIAACEATYTSLPLCTATPAAATDGRADFDTDRCCRKCRRPPPASGDGPVNGRCTKQQIRNCFNNLPLCRDGERAHVDAAFCCPSCKRAQRVCALEDIVRCFATIPPCADGELPALVPGECCPTCEPVRPACTCPSNQICVYPRNPEVPPTCFTRQTITITLTPNSDNTNALAAMTGPQLRFLLREIIHRWCDQNRNAPLCRLRDNQLRNTEITGTANADGSYTVTVAFAANLGDNTDGDDGTPGGVFSGDSVRGIFAAALGGRSGATDGFKVMDTNTDIYISAAGDSEAAAGYTATGDSSDANAAVPSMLMLLATAAAALVARRF